MTIREAALADGSIGHLSFRFSGEAALAANSASLEVESGGYRIQNLVMEPTRYSTMFERTFYQLAMPVREGALLAEFSHLLEVRVKVCVPLLLFVPSSMF